MKGDILSDLQNSTCEAQRVKQLFKYLIRDALSIQGGIMKVKSGHFRLRITGHRFLPVTKSVKGNAAHCGQPTIQYIRKLWTPAFGKS